MSKIVITIDGPGGSGKSTVARKLAIKLGFIHLNSGALYRVVGIEAWKRGKSLDDDQAISALTAETSFEFSLTADQSTRLSVDGRDISNEISSAEAGKLASQIGVLPGVRAILSEVQRKVAQHNSVVVEGRDAGTVVFPYAMLKICLDADLDIRAERRLREELSRQEQSASKEAFEQVKAELDTRDMRDSSRAVAPHRRAEDSILIDTSRMSVDEVVAKIAELFRVRCH